MPVFESNQQKIAYATFGNGETLFLWAHGWGHNRAGLERIASSLTPLGTHILIDFPGFGESPIPATDWTIGDYADFMAAFLRTQNAKKIIWIGHSFGCRVGIKLAATHPDLITKLILISAPGLPRKRPLWQSLYFALRVRLFKILKHLLWKAEWKESLRRRFSSADFNNAGPLRHIFMNTIREILADDAAKISCPVLLLCGAQDSETPPDISTRYAGMMKSAQADILDGFDHYTILTGGAPLCAHRIKSFVTESL